MEIPPAIIVGAAVLVFLLLLRICCRLFFPRLFDDCWLCDDANAKRQHHPSDHLKVNVETVVEIADLTKKLSTIHGQPLFFNGNRHSVSCKEDVVIPLKSMNCYDPDNISDRNPLATVLTTISLGSRCNAASKWRSSEAEKSRTYLVAACDSAVIPPPPTNDQLEDVAHQSSSHSSHPVDVSEYLTDDDQHSTMCEQELNQRVSSWLTSHVETGGSSTHMLLRIPDAEEGIGPTLKRFDDTSPQRALRLPERPEKPFDFAQF